ncbi:MAG: YeiH family protein [Candidatus Baltobacteraceae bacterium]
MCVAIAVAAYFLGRAVPVVGAPVFGIALGALAALLRPPSAGLKPGIAFASRTVLQISIVVLGATLQLREVYETGRQSLPVLAGSAVITLAAAYVFGKLLRVPSDLRRLLGVGTTVCGGSAIAALSSAIEVSETSVAYAISTVFFFNVVAVLTFPWIGHALSLSQRAFGLWAGTAINDTSSVVAAGYSYGHAAGNYAVIVKLTRTLLIVPIVFFYAGKRVVAARRSEKSVPWRRILPWFIVWFAAAALLNTVGAVPPAAQAGIAQTALFLIVIALSGVGLSVDARAIRAAGAGPLLLGLLLWCTIAAASLALARAAGIG